VAEDVLTYEQTDSDLSLPLPFSKLAEPLSVWLELDSEMRLPPARALAVASTAFFFLLNAFLAPLAASPKQWMKNF